jgi:phosphate/sulfate permease
MRFKIVRERWSKQKGKDIRKDSSAVMTQVTASTVASSALIGLSTASYWMHKANIWQDNSIVTSIFLISPILIAGGVALFLSKYIQDIRIVLIAGMIVGALYTIYGWAGA